MSWTPIRIVLHIFSILLLISGIFLTAYGLVITSWQTLNITEFNVYHEHGLWRDCWVSTITSPARSGTPLATRMPWKCTYKFNQPAHETSMSGGTDETAGAIGGSVGTSSILVGRQNDGDEFQHANLKWHRVVLGLLAASCIIGVLALLFSFCSFCVKPYAVVWCALTFISSCCTAAGMIIFFRCSHDKDVRFVHYYGKIYEQKVGNAFYFGIAGCLTFLVAAIFSVLTTVVLFLGQRQERLPHKTWPKHHTAV